MSKARASRVKKVSSVRKNPKAINPGNCTALGGKYVGKRPVSPMRVHASVGRDKRIGEK